MYITILECLTAALVVALFTLGRIWAITLKSRNVFKEMCDEFEYRFKTLTGDIQNALNAATYSHISEILVEKVLCYYKDMSNGTYGQLSDYDIPRVIAKVLVMAKSVGDDSIPLLERLVSYELSPDLRNLCNNVIDNFHDDEWCDEFIITNATNESSSQSDCAPEVCGSCRSNCRSNYNNIPKPAPPSEEDLVKMKALRSVIS